MACWGLASGARRERSTDAPPTQDDPHKLRRLRRPTGPHKDGATLDDLREAMTTLEEIKRIAWRVLGGKHPTTKKIEQDLQKVRAALRAREETQPSGSG